MQLQKLEIKGFKSFGEKVVIHFDKGVTAIVGPNGSGKSNVVDAIRWVLGEQSSRALRSDKMENVIFNGTKSRKPLQMAEVTLGFQNTRNLLPTEFTEVLISRRYYRSGDSEYLLNGVTCRLKDIQDLFLDTGIGPDSYAIIELKMVDNILNDVEGSRRQLFEEAAGISKFKKRKKETLKKLEETRADLERVEDLLAEISRNLKTLERQAKQAEGYLVLRGEYRKMSIQLACLSVKGQVELLQRLAKEVAEQTDQKTALQAKIAEIEAVLEKERSGLIQQEKLLASRQKALNEQVHQIRQFESDKKIKNERLRYLNERANSLQMQLQEDVKSNERATFSLESLEREQESLDKLLKEAQFLLERYKKDYDTQKQKTESLRQQVQETGNQLRNRQNAVYQLRKNLEINQVQQTSLKQELEREQVDSSQKTASMEGFDERLSELEGNLGIQKRELESRLAKRQELEQRIGTEEPALKSLEEQLAKSSRLLDAKQNEFNLTKSMLDNLEGYPQAIKFIKKSTEWGKDALLLSDIITCEEKYRVAIENYLEPFLNYYILQTEEQAYEAVNLLSDAAKGRGNFFVLDHLSHYAARPYRRQFEHAIPAINIMEYDEKYRALVHFLLEDVYIITQNQDNIPKDPSAVFITQNGKLARRPYSMTGGSVGLFEGKKLGRAKNLEKLSVEIRDLQQRNKGLEKIIAQQKTDLQALKAELARTETSQLQQQVSRMSEEYVALKTKKEQFEALLLDKANKQEAITEKLAQLREQVAELQPELKAAEEALRNLEEQQLDLSESLDEQAQLESRLSAQFNQQNILYNQQSNRAESIEKEIEYKQTNYERIRARIENSQQELKHTEDEIRQLQENFGQNEQQLIEMYEQKERLELAVNEAEKTYYQARGTIADGEKQVREWQRNRELADQLLLEIREKATQVRLGITSVKERTQVEFEVDLEQAVDDPQYQTEQPEELLREEVQRMKGRMEKMGPINHMAIEAYREIKERHDFIVDQKKDLEEAMTSLQNTIAEIDTVARENFLAAFHKIRENFIKVFRSLFTQDDKCDLVLLNPADPLESKIEITAQPKGKRPLTINQLSGGEKTLTATALLFSIYLLKPAPFCIFDEVDAPLDDANIDKFNNIIKEFSNNSQFIVVTHNKRTMASTDIIYGITMVEQGISTVVPVDLREYQ